MATEPANFIADLNAQRPAGDESLSEADDHLRLLKKTITSTFIGNTETGDIWNQELRIGPAALNALDETLNLSGFVTVEGSQTISGGKTFTQSIIAASGVQGSSAQNLIQGSASGVDVGYSGGKTVLNGPDDGVVLSTPSDGEGIVLSTKNWQRHIVDTLYPVGAIMFLNVTGNPAVLFPGTTWIPQATGRFIMATGAWTDTNGDTRTPTLGNFANGTYRHVMTEAEMPSHVHGIDNNLGGGYGWPVAQNFNDTDVGAVATSSAGNDQSHQNSPPGFALNCWERVA